MKKILITSMIALAVIMQSCATILGGKVSDCQKRKPLAGEQQRKVRVGAILADIVFFCPGLIVDFSTGAIYKPCK